MTDAHWLRPDDRTDIEYLLAIGLPAALAVAFAARHAAAGRLLEAGAMGLLAVVFGGGLLIYAGLAPIIPGVDAGLLEPEEIESDEIEDELLILINEKRNKEGVTRLTVNEGLQAQTERHAEMMVENDKLAHTVAGSTAGERLTAAGCEGGSENAAGSMIREEILVDGERIYTNDAEAVAETLYLSWMSSEEHRENMLSGRWTLTGLSVGVDTNGTVYASQNFC